MDSQNIQTNQTSQDNILPTDNTNINSSQVIFDLESLIKQHLTSIDQSKEQLEKAAGSLEDIFNNDTTFRQHSDAAKEAARIKSATKQQILRQPQAADLADKVKTLKSEIKQLQDALSDYLREYQRMTGVNEIEDDAGEVREIVYTAKLVRKFQRNK